MSIITRTDGTFVPVREQRTTTGTLSALNAEVMLPLNGDESTLIQINGASAVTLTVSIEGSVDGGVNYFPLLALPYAQTTGTIAVASQVLISEAFAAVAPFRVYAMATGGLSNIRIRASAWTSGSLAVVIRSGPEFSIHPNTFARVSTLCITGTAAVSTAVTVTLPAVAGLRHYIDRISIVRSCSTAVAAAVATPIVVTTTNIPGNPAFTFGQPIAAVGQDAELVFDAGSTGLATTAIGTATTVVAPIFTGMIWRITVIYRLGI